MRSSRLIATGCLLLWLSACAHRHAPADVGASPSLVTISIVGTNDLHGALLTKDGRGGVALLGGYLKNLREARARDGGAVLLLDAGDMFHGTLESNLSEGAPVVSAYNALGYTAAAVGNHEFDFGPVGPAATPRTASEDPRGALKARAAEAAFPFLAANLMDDATGRPVAWPNVQPTAMVQAAGTTIGIIGVMTRAALSATIAGNVGGLSVAPVAETIRAHATALREQGAGVIVVAAHVGGSCRSFGQPDDLSSCDPASEVFTVARDLPRGLVDVIVAGHRHAAVAHRVEGVAITSAYANGRAFSRVDLTVDRRTGSVAGTRIFPPRLLCVREDPATQTCAPDASSATLVPTVYQGAPVVSDEAIDRALVSALEQVLVLKDQPVGVVLETPFGRQGPGPLNMLFTDAMLASTPGADVALVNGAGVRADLPSGPLTYGSVFEALPFDNVVVPIRLTGGQLRQVIASQLGSSRPLLRFSGMRVRARCAGSVLDVALTRPSGVPILDDEALLVVVSDFLATGGDGVLADVTPQEGFVIPDASPLQRDVFAAYVGSLEGPLRADMLVDERNPRFDVLGERPLSCVAQ